MQINALRFADFHARGAFCTGALFNLQSERRAFREPAQQCADRAERVAVEPSAKHNQHKKQDEEDYRLMQRADDRPTRFDAEKSMPADRIRQTHNGIVCQRGQWPENVRCDAAKIAVRIEQRQGETAPTGHGGDDRRPQKCLSQPRVRSRIRGRAGFSFHPFCQAIDDVLQNSQRTNCGTINTSHRQRDNGDDDASQR